MSRLGLRPSPEAAPTSKAHDVTESLTDAAALAARNRFDDAIQLLSEANRRARDARLERELVETRFRAFRESALPDTPPGWPETVDDLTPETSLPEITPENLTVAQLRSAIANHGYLIVRGLLDDETADRLTRAVEKAIAAYDCSEAGEDQLDLSGWYEPFPHDRVSDRARKRMRGSVLTVDSPAALFELLESFDRAGLPQLAREYFGERPAILARKATLRRVSPTPKNAGWHQDGAFMGADIRSLNIWVALTDCGVDAPSLDLVTRRATEILPTGDGAFAAWGLRADVVESFADGAIVRPEFQRGDAIFFDHLAVHRTGMHADMPHDRYALETWLLAPSTYGAMSAPGERGYSPRDQIPIMY